MAKNRHRTNLVHYKDGKKYDVSKEISTGKLFIKGTFDELNKTQVQRRPKGNGNSNYDFSKPFQAQGLGDEWGDYAWTADDY